MSDFIMASSMFFLRFLTSIFEAIEYIGYLPFIFFATIWIAAIRFIIWGC